MVPWHALEAPQNPVQDWGWNTETVAGSWAKRLLHRGGTGSRTGGALFGESRNGEAGSRRRDAAGSGGDDPRGGIGDRYSSWSMCPRLRNGRVECQIGCSWWPRFRFRDQGSRRRSAWGWTGGSSSPVTGPRRSLSACSRSLVSAWSVTRWSSPVTRMAVYSIGASTAVRSETNGAIVCIRCRRKAGGPSADGIEGPLQAERPAETHRATRD